MLHTKIPEPTLRRLPFYLAYLKLIKQEGQQFVSSTQISKGFGADSSQVAKDLSYINISGKTRVGYDVESLTEVLEKYLGFSIIHEAFLFGAGSLGGALLHDNGLTQFGLFISKAFDVNPDLTGKVINDVQIHHIDELPYQRRLSGTKIGILCVPVEKAQLVAEMMIQGGIRAIWNFTPVKIKTPENVIVQNTSLYAHLAVMFNKLLSLEAEDPIIEDANGNVNMEI